jgi:hypothetical protein
MRPAAALQLTLFNARTLCGLAGRPSENGAFYANRLKKETVSAQVFGA